MLQTSTIFIARQPRYVSARDINKAAVCSAFLLLILFHLFISLRALCPTALLHHHHLIDQSPISLRPFIPYKQN
ncbi:uncharacterized protein BDW70DRAFT_146226 [Aspergillus foveolatus]|uniref:uncharacterized protein n=1 Tax=Aspergillus foveolatus TaxID=210207 RepID=UPI003CCDE328